ncbi:MAG TPA: PKD domain-containing protein [Bacteroidales bacterium]|nr:PKD domain-containing protein [Bacteroidales bacterium]HQG76431.1 PKD domain-containing protein [Bacteroidales bacterium]
MKNILKTVSICATLFFVTYCTPQMDEIGKVGPAPANAKLTVNTDDPYNPVFTVTADNGYIYHWDMGNKQIIKPGKPTETSYYPFEGTYTVVVTVYGEGAASTTAEITFTVENTDPTVFTRPVWRELTGEGAGKTWVYNTDPETGIPDYCYQTWFNIVEEPDCWMPQNSWGQCVQITPDIKGEMVFDLDGGINYTYHHEAGDEGVKGTFILDAEKMTITIKDPYILDHDIECTNPAVTSKGTYRIVLLTDDEMVLWQDQKDEDETGWSWSFKRKGYNPPD